MCFYLLEAYGTNEEDIAMFCSKCGKTIRYTDSVCPHCEAPIGDNRFEGTAYTSAQFTIAPGQKTFEALNNYTRTTYTSMDDAAQEGSEVDSRTTYRPVYEGASAPEAVRRDMRAAMSEPEAEEEAPAEEEQAPAFVPGMPLSPAAQETLNELDEELKPEDEIDRSQFKSRPIQSSGRAGISRDVSEYIRQLEDNQTKRAASRRKASAPVYDDYAAEGEDDGFAPVDDFDNDNLEAFDDIDDEDFDDVGAPRFNAMAIIKVVIALVIVAALVFGGIKWIGYIRGNQSSAPIEGVSETLYEQGVALVKEHVDSAYINNMITKYTSDGILSMSTGLEEGNAAIRALMPAEPAANDQTFMDALMAIQDNIVSAITMDALSVGSSSETAVADSEARWAIVNNSIVQLESAKSAAELTAVINGQAITVQQETPAPTAEPSVNYNSLSKGDESNEVLKLQNRLYELGFLNDDRDGAYGSKTQTAVKLFQEAAGINASGIADSETQQRLYADDAPYAPGKATPQPTATVAPTPEPTSDAIQPAEAAGMNAA